MKKKTIQILLTILLIRFYFLIDFKTSSFLFIALMIISFAYSLIGLLKKLRERNLFKYEIHAEGIIIKCTYIPVNDQFHGNYNITVEYADENGNKINNEFKTILYRKPVEGDRISILYDKETPSKSILEKSKNYYYWGSCFTYCVAYIYFIYND